MKPEYLYKYNSPIGILTILSDGSNLTNLRINDTPYSNQANKVEVNTKDLSIMEETKEWLDCYFAEEEPDFMPSMKVRGTEFRQSVWKILCEIPYGKVITYGEIAKKIASQRGISRMSAQAVGGAVGSNPIAILIPCHRVIGAKGNLTGFGGGIDKKIRLLQLEGLDTSKFHMP